MPDFAFRARSADGQLQAGRLQAPSAGAAADEIAGRGWVPLAITRAEPDAVRPAADRTASGGGPAVARGGDIDVGALLERLRPGAGARRHHALALTLREIAALLKAGVPILRSLQLTADACHDPQVAALLRRLVADLDAGRDLSAAAAREAAAGGLLTPYDVAMLQVGERTGRLVESFATLHRHREFIRNTREQVAQALRYPGFVIGTCLLALVVVNVFVIPQFARIFESMRADLPALTVFLLAMSDATMNHWPIGLAGLAAGVWAVRRWYATPQGRRDGDRWLLRVPVVGGILRGILMARFTGSFSSSFGAGLTVPQALEVTAQTLGNAWMEDRVRGMVRDLERGASIAQAARTAGVFPPTLLQLVAIGEETGSLEELTAEMSHHYESEVAYAVSRLSSAIEPLLIWLLAGGVLVLALGVFLPMWELGRAAVH